MQINSAQGGCDNLESMPYIRIMICKPKENQNYDAWLHWNISSQCNYDCVYCFGKTPVDKTNLRNIDIQKLFAVINKTGQTFRISFTGGEPFLIPNIVEACVVLTKDHFISFNTNLVLPVVKEFAEVIDQAKVLFIQASFHPEELNLKNQFNKYVEHFHLLKRKGFNIVAEAVSYPPYYSLLKEYEQQLKERNIELTYAPFIGKHCDKDYPLAYEKTEIEKWSFPKERVGYHYQKGEICNAGHNAAVVYSNGDVYPCFQIKEKIGNIYEGIDFQDGYRKCPAKFCGCPLNKYDPELFDKSSVHRTNLA